MLFDLPFPARDTKTLTSLANSFGKSYVKTLIANLILSFLMLPINQKAFDKLPIHEDLTIFCV